MSGKNEEYYFSVVGNTILDGGPGRIWPATNSILVKAFSLHWLKKKRLLIT